MVEIQSEQLENLRRRWEQDRSSRVFLQLAEEYRRHRLFEEAIEVLEEGLKHHATSLSARVALGRCRFALGQHVEAGEELERVVAQDPTQMVAYKLLVRAYLKQHQPDAAQERLDRYALLNAQDPEIEELAGRIAQQLREAETASAEAAPTEAVSAETEPPPHGGGAVSRGSGADPLGGEGASPPGSGLATAPAAAQGPSTAQLGAATVSPSQVFALDAAPLPAPDLAQLVPRQLQPRAERRRVAIQTTPAPEAPLMDMDAAPSSPPEEPPTSAPGPPEESVSPLEELPPSVLAPPAELAASTPPSREAFTLLQEEPSSPAPSLQEQAPVFPVEAPSPQPPSQDELEPLGDILATPPPEVSLAAPEVVMAPTAEVEPQVAPLESVAGTPSKGAPGARVAIKTGGTGREPRQIEGETETATLGQLYLRQGHTTEAERIFEQVLSRDPDNAVAKDGLVQISERKKDFIQASTLLVDVPESGLTERKIFLLNNYLVRLRQGSSPDVS